MQRIGQALKGQSGSYLASSMVGAFISLLVLGVVAAGIMGTSAFQAQLAVRSAVTNQASLTDSALRTDLIWASQVEARDSTSFTATVPGADGGCRISEWNIRDNSAGNREIANTVYSYTSYNPDTNPVSCSGGSTGRIETVMVADASPGAAFSYRNSGGYELTYKDGIQEARAHDAATKPAAVSTVNWKSTKLDTVILDTVIGYGADTAAPFRFSQTATNLDVVSNSPDGRPNFQEKGRLTAVEVGALAFNYAGSTTFDSSASRQYLSPTASGGTAPYKYSIAGGTLPGGVTFDTATGSFRGPAAWKPQVTSAAPSYDVSCAVAERKLLCWGNAALAGNGTAGTVDVPTAVTSLTGKDVTAVSTGRSHVCAVADGELYCWGSSEYGKLGNGSTAATSVAVPAKVQGDLAGKTVTAVSAGLKNTCAIADAKAYCWGEGQFGALGNGSTENTSRPAPVTAAGTIGGAAVTSITAGMGDHACAIADSKAFCWGALGSATSTGALGSGASEGSLVPVPVNLPGKDFSEISAGSGTTCAVASKAAYCWGNNGYGRLGNATATGTPALSPVAVKTAGTPLAGQTIKSVTVGYYHVCALAGEAAGTVSCWGSGSLGQMGNGEIVGSNAQPKAAVAGVLAGRNITSVTAGWDTTCAVTDGAVYCWGAGRSSKLGNGDPANISTPVPATGLSGNPGYPLTRTVAVTDAAGTKVTGTVTLWLE